MKRYKYIDDARGISILLIIMSHVIVNMNNLTDWQSDVYRIYGYILGSFYVPIFFIISGLFNPINLDNKLIKRIISLCKIIIIFIVFGALSFFILNNSPIEGILRGTPIWFLITLLYITILFNLIRCIKNKYLYFSIILIVGIIGVLLAYNNHSYLYIGQACTSLPFYAIGFSLKKYILDESFSLKRLLVYLFCYSILFLFFYKKQNLSLNLIEQNIVSFYLIAISGSLFVIEISKKIPKSFLLFSYLGKNTLPLLMVHIFLIGLLFSNVNIDSIFKYLGCCFIVIIVSIALIPIFKNKRYNIFQL